MAWTVLALFFALAILNSSARGQFLFTDQQSGWTLKPKQVEVGAAFGSVSLHLYGESGHVWNIFGLNLGVGVAERVEFRVRYGYVDTAFETHLSVVSFGPKIAVWRDVLAVYVPLEFAFGHDVRTSETWNIQPGLIASFPVGKWFEVTPSAKALIPLQKGEGEDALIALNLGIGIFATAGRNLIIRPEFGILFDPGDPGSYLQFGIGISYHTKAKA